jgi:hypothetical protein
VITDAAIAFIVVSLALAIRSRASLYLAAYHSIILVLICFAWMQSKYWPLFIESFHLWLSIITFALLFLIMLERGYNVLKLATTLLLVVSVISLLSEYWYSDRYITRKGYLAIYESYPISRLGFISMQIIGLIVYDDSGIHKRIGKLFFRLHSTFSLVFNYNHTHSQITQRVSK